MTTLAQTIMVWEDVEASLQRRVAYHRGVPLSDRDNRSFAAALAMLGCLLCDLRSRHGSIASDRVIIGFVHFVHSTDVAVIGSWLGDALTVLRSVESPTSFSWFKRQLDEYPVGMLVSPVRDLLEDFLLDPRPECFDVLSQFLSFLTRLSLQDLETDFEDEYEEFEDHLKSFYYPSSLLQGMNAIMCEWFADFHWEPVAPHHGPGATAELPRSATLEEKYSALSTDATLNYVLTKYLGGVSELWPYEPKKLVRTSKVVSVPKSMKTRRIISKEPAGLMYIQQGVKDQLAEFVRVHPFLRRHLTFEDQTPNAVLAIRGSADQSFATIDLSSASDCVTVTLVKALFRRTRLLSVLLGTRSYYTALPSGRLVRLEKFAPMGSALCFPVESLIFSCAVEYAVRRARTGLGYFPTWRVYGDDIVVSDALYEDVILILEAIGFVPNRHKSYASPTRFRESCGVEAYDGVDVTPLRISRRFYRPERGTLRHHAALYASLAELANASLDHNFQVLRTFILRMIFDGERLIPLFSVDGLKGIASPWPDNYRARHVWDVKYQRMNVEVDLAKPVSVKKKPKIGDERGALYETLRLTSNRSGDMFSPEHQVRVKRSPERLLVKRTEVEQPHFTVASGR